MNKQSTTYTVREVTARCGYDDPGNFVFDALSIVTGNHYGSSEAHEIEGFDPLDDKVELSPEELSEVVEMVNRWMKTPPGDL